MLRPEREGRPTPAEVEAAEFSTATGNTPSLGDRTDGTSDLAAAVAALAASVNGLAEWLASDARSRDAHCCQAMSLQDRAEAGRRGLTCTIQCARIQLADRGRTG
jgi:hypothetical protein